MIELFEKKIKVEVEWLFILTASVCSFILNIFLLKDKAILSIENNYQFVIILFICEIIYLFALVAITKILSSEKIIDFFMLSVLLYVAMLIRIICFDYQSGDFNSFLSPWVTFLRDNGGFFAIKDLESDYNFIYLYFLAIISYIDINELYLIKLFSIIFDFVLATYCVKLAGIYTDNNMKKLLIFFGVLLCPTVWLNSAFWSQCDSVYTAFVVMCLYYVLVGKPRLGIVCFTLGFLFKLQMIFFLPMLGVFYLTKKIELRNLIYIPTIYLINFLPGFFLGKSFKQYLNIYINQTSTYKEYLNLNSASFYAIISHDIPGKVFSSIGIYLAFAAVFILIYIAFIYREKFDNKVLLLYTMLFALVIPWLLPHMHDRYFFIADVFSIIIAVLMTKIFYISIMQIVSSLACYHVYFTSSAFLDLKYASCLIFALIIIISREIKKIIFE